MTAGTMPLDGSPACADPAYLGVVDASMRKGGAEAARLIRRYLCPDCPVAAACWVLGDGEAGVWGGMSRNERTKAGQKPMKSGSGRFNNMHDLHHLHRRTA